MLFIMISFTQINHNVATNIFSPIRKRQQGYKTYVCFSTLFTFRINPNPELFRYHRSHHYISWFYYMWWSIRNGWRAMSITTIYVNLSIAKNPLARCGKSQFLVYRLSYQFWHWCYKNVVDEIIRLIGFSLSQFWF